MKERIIIFCMFCLPLLLCGQDKSTERISQTSPDLQVGNEFELDQTTIKFLGVISDSRCPREVSCIWAGEAKILLGISLNGKYFEKEVTISGSVEELALAEELQLRVFNLRPYPVTAKGIAPEEYCLSLAVNSPVGAQ